MPMEASSPLTALELILARWGRRPDRLLQVLRQSQDATGWLSPALLAAIASALGLPLAHVRGVASFYSFFALEPAGAYRVLLSDAVTDRMDGSLELGERLCRRLWAEPDHTSSDGLVSVRRTSCTGLCDQGPAALVNGIAIPRLNAGSVDAIADLILARRPLAEWPANLLRVTSTVHREDLLLRHGLRPGAAIAAGLARTAAAPGGMVAELRESGLRGRGGAGYPTGSKWAGCHAAPADARYIVCNADEGEPGTFKDRVLLAREPDLVFEGMTLAGHATGATRGLLYLRGEYQFLLEPLEATLVQRRARGLLGAAAGGGPAFDIEIHVGAGAYICGEETALLESLEGRRGIPRNRPPYPVTHGYLGRPTVVDNVETLCAAAVIAVRGADAWRRIGTSRSSGTKLLSVAGDCSRRGVYEFPFGVSVREVLDAAGAEDPIAVQVGGPSGTLIDSAEFERNLSFEDLPTGGAFTVFGRGRDLFEVARQHVHFFAHESCGFCTPCRVGTSMLASVMDKIHDGHGSRHELAELDRLTAVLGNGAHCGLGHTAMNPVRDTITRFAPSYERRLASADFAPAFNLDAALAPARRMTGRDDAASHLGEGS
jgi:[NiFe] hydrogenase diaphorase moiety large subunit